MDEQFPKESPVFPKRIPLNEGVMNFANCLQFLVSVVPAPKFRRLEWPDDGKYVTMLKEQVVIYHPEDKQFHPLIISPGDILGEDWIMIGVARS